MTNAMKSTQDDFVVTLQEILKRALIRADKSQIEAYLKESRITLFTFGDRFGGDGATDKFVLDYMRFIFN